MITKQQKQQILSELVEQIREANALYFVDFATMTVQETQELRRQMREKGVSYRVAKNTLIYRALQEVGGYEGVTEKMLFGQTEIFFAGQDVTAPAKIIRDFSKKTEKPQLKVAVVESQVYGAKQLNVIAELPTREDMIAGILGSIHAPISGIVGSVNAVMRDVASLVEEVAKKKAA